MRIQSARDNFAWRTALDVRPDAVTPGGHGRGLQPILPKPSDGVQGNFDGDWAQNEWRGAPDGGAFHSSVRPPLGSDVPHPSEVLTDPNNHVHRAHLDRIQAAQTNGHYDEANDPWAVLPPQIPFDSLHQNQLDHHLNASDQDKFQGRVWYRAGHEYSKDLADKTTGDQEKAVDTMSAYSPLKPWDTNVEHATHFMTHYPRMNEGPEARGEEVSPGFRVPAPDSQTNKARDVAHTDEYDRRDMMGGPKTNAFAKNLLDPSPMREARSGAQDDEGFYQLPVNPHSGEPDWRGHPDQDTTVDTHQARLQTTPHGSDLSQARYGVPPHFDQFNGVKLNGKTLDLAYDVHSRAAWEAQRRANEMEPDPLRHELPKQGQARTWTKFKRDVDSSGSKNLQPEPGTAPNAWDPNKKDQGLGTLSGPIPRYQNDIGDWQDPRRPERGPGSDWNDWSWDPETRHMTPGPNAQGTDWSQWGEAPHPKPTKKQRDQGKVPMVMTPPEGAGNFDLRQSPNWMRRSMVEAWIARRFPHVAYRLAIKDPYLAAYDNPWTGPQADELRQACPYCKAGPMEEHDPRCPTNHTEDPKHWGQETSLMGPGGHYEVPADFDPMQRVNSLLDYTDGLITSFRKGAPFAGYDDFEACVRANQDKDDPEAYCGKIKHQVEDD